MTQNDRLEEALGNRKEPPTREVEKAKGVHKSVRRYFLRQPGVTGVDVGFKVADKEDRFTEKIAVRIHVKDKLPENVLKHRGWRNFSEIARKQDPASLPEQIAGLPVTEIPYQGALIDGVPLDVIEARYFPTSQIQVQQPIDNQKMEDRDRLKLGRSYMTLLVGGCSISRIGGPAGTLGAVVWDRTDGTACLLSNWHILAGSTQARIGQPCCQPAISDGGNPERDIVAILKRWIFDDMGDAALAEIACDRYYCPGEILGLNSPVVDWLEPKLGMRVRKWGRSSGFTKGFIDGIDLTINIDYGVAGIRQFENQVHIAPRRHGDELCSPGDSGSFWVHSSRDDASKSKNRRYYAVALHFAGDSPSSPSGEHAIASGIKELADRLEFSLRPVFVRPQGFVRQPRRLSTRPLYTAMAPGPALGETINQPSGPESGSRPTGPQPETEPINGGG